MRLKTLTTYTILLITCCLSANVNAQEFWGNDRLYDYYLSKGNTDQHIIQRFSVGIGKHYMVSNVNLEYTDFARNGKRFDTTAVGRLRLKKAYSGHIGTFFPIILLTDNSMLTFNTELYGTFGTAIFDSTIFGEGVKFEHEYLYYMVGIPLSVEYKSGADIPLSKKGSSMFSLGVGLNVCKTNFVGDDGPFPVTFAPFIKAEVGFVLGVAMKIRGVVYMGSSYIADDTQSGIGVNESGNTLNDQVKINALVNNGYSLSLVVMPFTYKWKSENW